MTPTEQLYAQAIHRNVNCVIDFIKSMAAKGFLSGFWTGEITTEVEFWLASNKIKYNKTTKIDNSGSQVQGLQVSWGHFHINEENIPVLDKNSTNEDCASNIVTCQVDSSVWAKNEQI
jgi:hypothetical protein